jgi:hypothetical protein
MAGGVGINPRFLNPITRWGVSGKLFTPGEMPRVPPEWDKLPRREEVKCLCSVRKYISLPSTLTRSLLTIMTELPQLIIRM